MFAGIVAFGFANALEPQINRQYDFFELSLPVSQWVAGIFGLLVAKRYWGSKVFGRAYLALGIGFLLWGTGSSFYTFLEIFGNPFPYPGPPDIFFISYFSLLLFHLTTNIRFFRKKLLLRDKLIVIAVPTVINIIFVFALLVPISVPGSVPDLLSHQIHIGNQTYEVVLANESLPQTDYAHITQGNQT